MYEAVHGSAPDIAGKNKANPTALILSSCMMLRDMGFRTEGDKIEKAVLDTITEGKMVTGDLGGNAGTSHFTQAIMDRLK